MISETQEREILARAYVPEHAVGLMTLVSGGEPFLIDDYFCCRSGEVLIVVGYPLTGSFEPSAFAVILQRLIKKLRPNSVLFIAPEIPGSLAGSCSERESDSYYRLDLTDKPVPGRLRRIAERAREHLRVERADHLTQAHRGFAERFVARVKPPKRVEQLMFSMWSYVGRSPGSLVLNAWDLQGNLAAFYVMDLTTAKFSTYVIGCHSKQYYAKGASDLLFLEMIQVSLEHGKQYIHLGLGVNKGIRQFKEKWGGVAFLNYELCALAVRKPSFLDAILGFRARA